MKSHRCCHPGSAGRDDEGQCRISFISTAYYHMSNTARPLTSIPETHGSLDVGHVSSPGSSTPSLFEERSLQSSASLPIMPPTVNVQFAPLPEISSRDRRSTRPLGMAARSQLLQQRNIRIMQGIQQHPRVRSDPDGRPMVCIPEEDQDDPLDALVRFIADKSKSLWKRVISKTKQSDNDKTTDIAGEATTLEGERLPKREVVPSTADDPNDANGISKN